MKSQIIIIKQDISLLVDSIADIIRSTIESHLPHPNSHKVEIDAYENNNRYIFKFWATNEQYHAIKDAIHKIYELGD